MSGHLEVESVCVELLKHVETTCLHSKVCNRLDEGSLERKEVLETPVPMGHERIATTMAIPNIIIIKRTAP